MAWLVLVSLVQVWQQAAPMPTPGYGVSCAVVNGRVYAIGGLREGDSLAPRRVVEAYDAAQDTWLTGFAPMPQTRWFCGCAALDGKIYVIGGTSGCCQECRVDRFDPATNHWDTVASLPWLRQGLGACSIQGLVYAVGGFAGSQGSEEYSRKVATFLPDGGAGDWTEIDSLNTPRASFGIDTVGGVIYVAGGVFFNALSQAEYYASCPEGWNPVQRAMNSARGGLACVGYDRYLCAVGGTDGNSYFGSVEVLDCSTGMWTEVEPLNTPRAYLSAAIVGNDIIVIGGRSQQGTLGAVETHPLFIEGVGETRPELLPVRPHFATFARGQIRIKVSPNQSVEVVDGRGNIVAPRTRSVDIQLPPGVYFARVRDAVQGCSTRKIVVVK
jgi:N-acetylneuraminic acid mutarotase